MSIPPINMEERKKEGGREGGGEGVGLIAVRQIHVHKQTPPAIDVHLRHCKYVCMYVCIHTKCSHAY